MTGNILKGSQSEMRFCCEDQSLHLLETFSHSLIFYRQILFSVPGQSW